MARAESSGATSIDIEEIASSMAKEINYYLSLAEVESNTKRSCLIQKVQNHIREIDQTAYEPCIVSIGPYHHGNPCLQTSQKKKWNCLNYILYMNYNVRLCDYLQSIVELEMQARNCYLNGVNMDSSEFLQMLLVDSCFILVHLWGIDGIEISQRTVRVTDTSEKTNKRDITEHDRKFLSEDRSFEGMTEECKVRHQGTSTGGLELTGQSSKMNGSMNALPISKAEPTDQLCPTNHETFDKNIGHHQDGKWYYSRACHDIIMLENQIPFFVVNRVYKLVAGTQNLNRLTDNIGRFVEGILYVYPKAIQAADRPKNFHHLLHLFYMYFSPTQQEELYQHETRDGFFQRFLGFSTKYIQHGHRKKEQEHSHNHLNSDVGGKLSSWRRAVQYHEVGIEFKKRELNEQSPHSLLDIRFHSSVIEIPFLVIDQMTGPLFRNLIALEQTCPHFGNSFTAYAAFISHLTSSATDVSFLVKRGIIVHQMRSDDEVSVAFARLLENIDFDRNSLHYLRSTCIALEQHYQNRLNRWMAWLWQNHFSNPWLSLAVLAAILVLVCTILQLLFALLAYLSPVEGNSG